MARELLEVGNKARRLVRVRSRTDAVLPTSRVGNERTAKTDAAPPRLVAIYRTAGKKMPLV